MEATAYAQSVAVNSYSLARPVMRNEYNILVSTSITGV